MSILRDLFQSVGAQAVDAATPKVLLSNDREVKYAVGGNVVSVFKAPAPRNHKLESLADVAALANRFKKEGRWAPAVWCSKDAVTVVFDDALGDGDDESHRVEKATVDLPRSDVFTTLAGLAASGAAGFKAQKDFVRLLRIDLANASGSQHLLAAVRRVTFSNGTTTVAEKRSQKESIGREIVSQLNAEADVPEEVLLHVPFWKAPGPDFDFGVRCSVEVEPAQEVFRLRPLPDEVERVAAQALLALRQEIQEALDEGIPVYAGEP